MSQAYTISSAAPPREYRNFEPAIFAAVAVTSLRISPEGATGNGANTANTMMITYKTPAILALKRGDTSAILSALTAVFILVSDHHRGSVELKLSPVHS